MDKSEDFLCAWRTRFSVTDIPSDVIECLQSSDNDKLREILKKSKAKVAELQNKLHQQEFLASFLWDYLKDKAVSPSSSLDDQSELDKPIPVSDFSPTEHHEPNSYDNLDGQTKSHTSSGDDRSSDSNVLPSQILRAQKPVPAPRASHVAPPSVKDRASVFVQSVQKDPPPKLPNRGNSLDSKAKPNYAAVKETSTQNSFKKDKPNVPPKRRHVHAYEEVDIPMIPRSSKPNSFGKQISVDYSGSNTGNISPNKSPSDVMQMSYENKQVEYENVNSGVSSFKPITRPAPSSHSPKLHRGSPVHTAHRKQNASPVVPQQTKQSDEIYDEPIPVSADTLSDDDGSSSDEEPLYHNLLLLKKQQQNMDNRLYSSVDVFKNRLERDAKKLSHRFSVNNTDIAQQLPHLAQPRARSMLAPVKAPVMKPLKSAFIAGVTEEESSTESGMHILCCSVNTSAHALLVQLMCMFCGISGVFSSRF